MVEGPHGVRSSKAVNSARMTLEAIKSIQVEILSADEPYLDQVCSKSLVTHFRTLQHKDEGSTWCSLCPAVRPSISCHGRGNSEENNLTYSRPDEATMRSQKEWWGWGIYQNPHGPQNMLELAKRCLNWESGPKRMVKQHDSSQSELNRGWPRNPFLLMADMYWAQIPLLASWR